MRLPVHVNYRELIYFNRYLVVNYSTIMNCFTQFMIKSTRSSSVNINGHIPSNVTSYVARQYHCMYTMTSMFTMQLHRATTTYT